MQMEQGRWVAHTHEVLHQLEILSSQLSQARANQTYALRPHAAVAHDEQVRIVKELKQTTETLTELTADNSAQHARIEPLWQAIAASLASAEPDGAAKFSEIANRIREMSSEEEQLLKEREAGWHQAMLAARYSPTGHYL
jgi:hypothetical protein